MIIMILMIAINNEQTHIFIIIMIIMLLQIITTITIILILLILLVIRIITHIQYYCVVMIGIRILITILLHSNNKT